NAPALFAEKLKRWISPSRLKAGLNFLVVEAPYPSFVQLPAGRIPGPSATVIAADKNMSERQIPMRNALISLLLPAGLLAPAAGRQPSKSQARTYQPIGEYLMPQAAEIALAKSAAPANISDRASIKVLTTAGFKVVHEGDSGFVCVVMRGFSAPTY